VVEDRQQQRPIVTLRMAFMITGNGVHDRPEWPFTINWIGCSRSNGIGVHDPPERAAVTRSGSSVDKFAAANFVCCSRIAM
jgi:hypothetical protein